MIILDNESTWNTSIILSETNYEVVEAIYKSSKDYFYHGIGGFSEDKELVGLCVYNKELYFCYNNISYKTSPKDICCDRVLCREDEDRKKWYYNFIVKINNKEVCNIKYIPYISPLAMPFSDDLDEFDYLYSLNKVMKNEKTLNTFMGGMMRRERKTCERINRINKRKNHFEVKKQILSDKPNFVPHIPKFPKLEQVVPLPFHEKTNQFIIDYKDLSEKSLWEKYNLQSVWFDVDDYVVASKKHGALGLTIINVLVDFGFILQLDYKEELSDYEIENFWGDEPVKLVQFDLENDSNYYAYIPQSTDLKSIFDVKIYEVSVGEIKQDGLDMGGLK